MELRRQTWPKNPSNPLNRQQPVCSPPVFPSPRSEPKILKKWQVAPIEPSHGIANSTAGSTPPSITNRPRYPIRNPSPWMEDSYPHSTPAKTPPSTAKAHFQENNHLRYRLFILRKAAGVIPASRLKKTINARLSLNPIKGANWVIGKSVVKRSSLAQSVLT